MSDLKRNERYKAFDLLFDRGKKFICMKLREAGRRGE